MNLRPFVMTLALTFGGVAGCSQGTPEFRNSYEREEFAQAQEIINDIKERKAFKLADAIDTAVDGRRKVVAESDETGAGHVVFINPEISKSFFIYQGKTSDDSHHVVYKKGIYQDGEVSEFYSITSLRTLMDYQRWELRDNGAEVYLVTSQGDPTPNNNPAQQNPPKVGM